MIHSFPDCIGILELNKVYFSVTSSNMDWFPLKLYLEDNFVHLH